MIFIDRLRVQPPEILFGRQAEARRKAAENFFAGADERRIQKRFDFNVGFARQELASALRALFHGKCAYCEQPIEFGLDRYRPTSNSLGSDGRIDPDHYWWLAYDWSNLYSACSGCSRAKANRFPIQGKRARRGIEGMRLHSEMPLLLDPCMDQPAEHIDFDVSGRVIAKSERGHVTIETLALNRPQLIELRRSEADKVIQDLNEGNLSESRIKKLADDAMPFAAMRRDLLQRPVANNRKSRTDRHGLQEQHKRDLESTQYTVGPKATAHDRAVERSRTRYIERVVLKNVGIHGNLDLHTARAETSNAPWMMLLGENGVGKTTLLKAIAFALAVPQQKEQLGQYSLSVLPRDGKTASIAIHYTDGEVIKATIDSAMRLVETNFVEPRFRLLALGATRLPPTAKRRPPRQPSYAKVMNLFDPFCPLEDSVRWLAAITDKEFERAGAALKALLSIPRSAMFERRKEQVSLRQGMHQQDLRALSDGYQTIIGVACAIMSTLVEADQPVETAEGIVLIDEIGNHLHPTWRMRIVPGLKAAFPRVQFIATTHEPLCLRGLEDGEIAVLRRNASHRSMLIDELPPVRGLLVDQILSSAHFGLGSTIDPETADKFDLYYTLLAKKELSPKEKERLTLLQDELNRIRLIGNTPSEQILLRTIDERVARANSAGKPLDPGDLPNDLQDELVEILELATKRGPSPEGTAR